MCYIYYSDYLPFDEDIIFNRCESFFHSISAERLCFILQGEPSGEAFIQMQDAQAAENTCRFKNGHLMSHRGKKAAIGLIQVTLLQHLYPTGFDFICVNLKESV